MPSELAIPAACRRARLSDLLVRQAAATAAADMTFGDIARFLGDRSIGAVLFFLSLPTALPIQVPGFSSLFGLPLIFVSAQLILGFRPLWLPAGIARRSIRGADFAALVARVLPILQRLERVVRPRATWMARPWAGVPLGMFCLVLAIVIALPIPLGHVVPSCAIALVALGLVEHDGLAIGLGLIVGLLGMSIIVVGISGIFGLLDFFRSG